MSSKRNRKTFRENDNQTQIKRASTINQALLKTADELQKMNKEQLKIECRKRGQKSTGSKQELLQRLGNKMVNQTKRKDATAQQNGDTVQNHTKNKSTEEQKKKEKTERESIVLWKRPLITIEYFFRECYVLLSTYGKKILASKKLVLAVLTSVLLLYILINFQGPHHRIVQRFYKQLLWCLYWLGLGILSSVGLGTGLHTFLLYLGPFIAQVTLAAYECESLNFPEPPYPDEIVCPSERDPLSITILSIMSKVRIEAMCWGAGTALGELPPYFMARTSRLSGIDPDDDDDLKELEELEKKKNNRDSLTLIERVKLFVEETVQKVGFLGILACASIPNPLFDLAGITCGHFLVPFWTFFGATLIGKAIIKMHIQKMFVIIAFNETLIQTALEWLKVVPIIGDKLQIPFKAFLDGQKQKLHKNTAGTVSGGSGNILSSIFEIFVMFMVLYFVISIVNSFAQSYHKRIHKNKNTKNSKD
nr:vacuole membrane protein 1 isoform X2 [Leptinotarsa decemlineata]XP_023015660.1 vacuole membrane protein 1 isoform X2 [Leptinotarsa decemlineata]